MVFEGWRGWFKFFKNYNKKKTYIEKEIEYLRFKVKAILVDSEEYTGLSLFRFMDKSLRKLIKLSKRIDELEDVLKNL